jgi:hypothetical protein
MDSQQMDAIKALLGHGVIRERREGVEQLRDLLNNPVYREEAVALLEGVRDNPREVTILQDLARQSLEDDQRRRPALWRAEERRFIVGRTCHNCHNNNYFDKRVLCSESRPVFRGDVPPASPPDSIRVPCKFCQVEMAFEVDCEGIV